MRISKWFYCKNFAVEEVTSLYVKSDVIIQYALKWSTVFTAEYFYSSSFSNCTVDSRYFVPSENYANRSAAAKYALTVVSYRYT